MNSWTEDLGFLDALDTLLGSGRLPEVVVKKGRKILSRASEPVKILILGPQGAGKTQLANLLVGRRVVDAGAPCPPLEFTWSESEFSEFTYTDGSTAKLDGLHTEPPKPGTVTRLRLGLPAQSLNRVSLVEFTTGKGAPESFLSAVAAVDLVIWCGQDFQSDDKALWDMVPDAKKDHSFFVLTKADVFAAEGRLQDRLTSLQEHVGDEFHSLVPVATLQALNALPVHDDPSERAYQASGGKALVSTIARHVETGRKADLDTALLFLTRYGLKPAEQPHASPPANRTGSRAQSRLREGTSATALPPALELMRARGKELLELARDNQDRASAILAHCVATSEQLVGLLGDIDDDAPDAARLYETALDAADMIILMQMEDGIGPAADAVSVMLQLRREIESEVAA